jgi:prefoldin subunit 5
MPGIEFDRGAFVPAGAPPKRSIVQMLSPILFLLAVGVVALVGYKIYAETEQSTAIAANSEVQRLQQQLAEMQKRLDQMEKRHKAPPTDASTASADKRASSPPTSAPVKKTVYNVTSASALPPRIKPAAAAAVPPSPAPTRPENNDMIANEIAANREAWQAATNRLSDVVGVVGTQQEEINATREAVNQLLTETHRRALSFELDRDTSGLPVGPVTLQLKSADSKNQHYTVCVYFDRKCVELKNRALNEVVVFLVTKDGAPLELVATKIQRDQIVGYLEVPSEKQ